MERRNRWKEMQGRQVRRALFASTALVLPAIGLSPAGAQSLAPAGAQSINAGTTPQGGVVVGGSAAITQGPGSTTINQASSRAAINWQSFSVGSNAQVQFNQPSASAIALNRVVGGNLSVINGRINANGQIVLINQSGVVFAKGSQVNAESVVVSTSDLAPAAFMAGSLAFTGAPAPGAKIINEGSITAGQAGLVGLVAPQVANAGIITARLGQVVLAGASAFTLDLYGDRLISLDVTRAVRAIDLGGRTVPALVTNSGVIIADGGQINLTAQQADALVTQLVNAGGTIRADSVGAQTGTISLQGVGGDISIAGNLLARGTAPGSAGGAVQALTTGTVAVAPTAVIDASGVGGGGAVALGTDLARAAQGAADTVAPRAAAVTVAAGAAIRAEATGGGDGGKVVLLSSKSTGFDGAVSVQGGPTGGDGGDVEISSDGVISLGGTVLATAAKGRPGNILLDPSELIVEFPPDRPNNAGPFLPGGTITFGGTTGTGISIVDPAQLESLSGNVLLEAASLISVEAPVDMTNVSALSLVSLGDITINAAITVNGSLDLDAAAALDIGASLVAQDITLSGGTTTDIGAPIAAGTLLALAGAGGVLETSFSINGVTRAGSIDAPTLVSDGTIGGDVVLTVANTIGTLAALTLAAGHTLTLDDTGPLTVAGPVAAPVATLSADTIAVTGDFSGTDLALASTGNITGTGAISVATLSSGGTTIGGEVSLGGANTIATLAGFAVAAGNTFALDDTGLLTVAGPLTAATATLSAATLAVAGAISATELALEGTGNITETGTISAATLDSGGTTIGGDVDLSGDNTIGTLAGFILAAGRTFALDDTGLLDLVGPLTAPTATLSAATISITGSIDAATELALESTGNVSESGTISAGSLSSGGTTIGGDVGLTGTNLIGTLAGFALAAGKTLTLDDTGLLDVAGPVSAPSATLSAGTISITGAIAGTDLALASNGDIAGGGAISVATLTSVGTIGGNAFLTGANTIGTLAAFTLAAGKTLALDDTGLLSVAGPLNAPNATLAAATLAISGSIDATALALGSAGNITETGTINAATLSSDGTIGGDLVLNGSNTIGTLGGFALATGTLTLDDTGALIVTGPVTAPVITLVADSIGFQGNVSAATSLALGGNGAGSGTVTQTGGAISAGTLLEIGTLAGSVSLGGANTINNLGGFALGGAFSLNDGTSLTVIGTVATPGAITLSGTSLGETGGALDAGTLTTGAGNFSGGVVLGGGNAIATLAAFSAQSGLFLDDSEALTIAGLVFTTAGLTLDETGAIAEVAGGTLFAASLAGGAGGDVALTIANTIGTFSGFTVTGAHTLALDDDTALTVGDIGADDATITAPDISLAGSLEVGDLLVLDSGGSIVQDGGLISAGALGGSATGGVVLTLGNSIATLTGFSAGGDFALVDDGTLKVDGQVTAADVTLVTPTLAVDAGVTAAAAAGTLALVSDGFSAAADTLLNAAGTIEIAPFTAGRAIDIGGDAGGALDLQSSFIAALDPNAVEIIIGAAAGRQGGAIAIDNTTSFGVPLLDLQPGAAAITDNGTLTANTLAFGGAGFTQAAGGALTLAALEGNGVIAGPVLLASTLNNIAALGPLSVAGAGLILADAEALTVANTVAAADITLLDLVSLDTAAPLSVATGGAINLVADTIINGGAVLSAPGGLVAFAPYSGTDVQFGGAAAAGTLGIDAGFGTLVTADTLQIGSAAGHADGALAVVGPLTIAAPTLAISGTGISFAGNLTEPGEVTLSTGGTVTEATGAVITAGSLAGSGADVVLAEANQIGTLGNFSVATFLTLDDNISLAIAGSVSAATLALGDTGDITEAGTINAATLASFGTIDGNVVLTGSNTIATLAGFAVGAGGTLTLDDTGLLTVAGPVTAPAATLFSNTISITGAITATDLGLKSSGDIFESGAIDATNLSSGGTTIGGNVALTGTNTISTLAGFAVAVGQTFTLDNVGLLTVAGPLAAPTATLSSSTISITGAIAATDLALESSGDIFESGAIDATNLGSGGTTIGGNVALTGTNTIGTLADFAVAAGQTFALDDLGLLTVAGPLVAPTATLSSNTISITGTIAATDLALESSGNVFESGAINAATLSSGGTTIGGNVALTGTNTIGTLADFAVAAGQSFSLDDNGLLTVAGPLAAPTATLLSNTISITGDIAATDLALESSGDVFESGTISAGTLSSGGTTIGGNVALTGTNTIATLAGFALAAGQSFALDDTGLLTVAGPLVAPTATLSANTISIGGAIAATSLALESSGNIFESGAISAGTLSSGGTTIGGNVALTGTNTISTLAGFALAAGTFALDDTGLLTVTGPLVAPTATLSANTISITGNIAATALVLQSSGDIFESGTISAATLSSGGATIGGNVALSGSNTIATLAAFALASGTFTLDDTGLLTVVGPLAAPTTTLSADTISVTGNIDAASLALESTGNIVESGAISAGSLTSGGTTIGGNVALTGTNTINTLAGFALAAGTFALDDTGLLTVAGPLDAPTAALSAAAISIPGAIAATDLVLGSSGNINETGAISAGTLASLGTIGGNVRLLGTNTISTLAGFALAPATTLTLDDTGLLTVAGPLAAATATLSAGTISIAGGISATTELALQSTGMIAETGAVDTPLLTSGGTTIGGDVSLGGANSIAALGSFSLAGNFFLNDTAPLALAGRLTTPDAVTLTDPVSVAETTGAIAAATLAVTGPAGDILLGNGNNVGTLAALQAGGNITFANVGPLAIAGTVVTPGTLTLKDSAGITETGGAIAAGTLNSGGTTIGGNVLLAGANDIATLAGFTVAAGDALQLDDTTPLTVAGPVSAPYATLVAPSIVIAGAIDAGLLALDPPGGVTETTGAINAGTLTSDGATIGGAVLLNNVNRIATLGAFAALGDFSLDDLVALQIAGPVSFGGTLALLDPGAITETDGTITAAALTSDGGTVGGAAVFDRPGNHIPVLGNFAAAGGLTLADTGPLDLAGVIASGNGALDFSVASGGLFQTAGVIVSQLLDAIAPVITLPDANVIADLGDIDVGRLFVNGVAVLTGTVLADDATIIAPGTLALPGTATVTGTLSLASGGGIVQPAGGVLNVGDGNLATPGTISLSGTTRAAGQLNLVAGGAITHGAGVLDAGTLTGRAGGVASFGVSTDVGTLGSFLVQNAAFTLNNAGPLTFIGPLDANSASLAVNGQLTLDGTPDGGLFVTGNDAPKNVLTPRPGDTVISVDPDGADPAVVENGVFYVNAGPYAASDADDSGPATVFLDVAPAGNVAFAPAPPSSTGLYGPAIDLEVSVGSTGTITGNVDLFRVVVLSAASVGLTGFLDGVGGPEGAAKGIVNPFPNSRLQFNACPISSVNCTILPVESLPSGNPLQNFDIAQRKKHRLNKNIQLPGIATRDY